MEENRNQLKSPTKENAEDLFTTFQTVVHLSEDLKSNHVFIVMGASVNFSLEFFFDCIKQLIF
jgi:hypothetical protein